jgi:deoxycytidylate deaminase
MVTVAKLATRQKPSRQNNPKDTSYQGTVRELIANELVFAVVGPVGSGTSEIAVSLKNLLQNDGYHVEIVKARELLEKEASKKGRELKNGSKIEQSSLLQDLGDQIRSEAADNAAVAAGLVGNIRRLRAKIQKAELEEGSPIEPDGSKRAFILDSLRHPHEVILLRRIYQEAFYLIGVFCHEEERLARLKDDKYSDSSSDAILRFMDRDQNAPEAHGQKVADTFHLADFFVDNTTQRFAKIGKKKEENRDWDIPDQLGRLIDILTRSKVVTPTPNETGMFHAFGAKMRSSCLSRQVGASLIDASGALVATGTNEVPRAGGGVYGDFVAGVGEQGKSTIEDFRCFVHHRYCSNTREQNEMIGQLFSSIEELRSIKLDEDLTKRVRKTKIGQILEFSRAVHAEMDALLSAARTGARTVHTRMFVTTFPCHNCARHIVAAGVVEVLYIEPYLKSHAIPLHGDAIVTDPKKWVLPNKDNPRSANVLFRSFIGVAPRLYRRAFFKDRDLKNNLTGEMLSVFDQVDGHGATEALKVSYAQAEAKLADLFDRRSK